MTQETPTGSKASTSGENVVPLFPSAKEPEGPFLKTWAMDRTRIEMSAAELDNAERVDRLSRMWKDTHDMPWQRLCEGLSAIMTEMIRQRGPEETEAVSNPLIDIAYAALEAREG